MSLHTEVAPTMKKTQVPANTTAVHLIYLGIISLLLVLIGGLLLTSSQTFPADFAWLGKIAFVSVGIVMVGSFVLNVVVLVRAIRTNRTFRAHGTATPRAFIAALVIATVAMLITIQAAYSGVIALGMFIGYTFFA